MDRTEEYRANAQIYLAMALRARSEIWRMQLTEVARHWLELAHTDSDDVSMDGAKPLTH